jgi:hypothetical protein
MLLQIKPVGLSAAPGGTRILEVLHGEGRLVVVSLRHAAGEIDSRRSPAGQVPIRLVLVGEGVSPHACCEVDHHVTVGL